MSLLAGPLVVCANSSGRSGKFLDSYIEMTADLTLLLATLAIMTGALVITGVPTKLGAILIEAAGVNLAAMVVLAFVFGAMLGTGLPPAPTYILVAIVIAPPMIKVGVNPWVVHFFAFFLGVWGELTPPTSLVAAVTAKIANASFYTTLNRALQICVSLFTLMAGVFVHPDAGDRAGRRAVRRGGCLILVSTIGITFSLQALLLRQRAGPTARIRLVLAAFALVVLLCPDERIGASGLRAGPADHRLLADVRRAVRGSGEHDEPVPAEAVLAVPVPQIVDTERGRMQSLSALLRLGERQRRVLRNLRAEHVERHRDHRVVAADADQLDHAGVAEEGVHALVGFVADPPGLVHLLDEIDDRQLILRRRLRRAPGLDVLDGLRLHAGLFRHRRMREPFVMRLPDLRGDAESRFPTAAATARSCSAHARRAPGPDGRAPARSARSGTGR